MILKKWKYSDLEDIADRFLDQHGKYDNRCLRIEQTLTSAGLRIWPVPGLAAYAEAYIPIKSGFVFIDEEQYQKAENFRYRFTLAEELAHHLIHRPYFEGMSVEEIQKTQKSFSDGEYVQLEREAKRLAGAILMRKSLYLPRYMQFYGDHRERGGHHLNSIKFAVQELSKDFFASCVAVAIRAVSTEMIDQEEFEDLGQMWDAVSMTPGDFGRGHVANRE